MVVDPRPKQWCRELFRLKESDTQRELRPGQRDEA
jgi:hypothetical protein